MAFRDGISRYADEMEARKLATHDITVELAKQSWQFGSPTTGSPGVIVDLGNLRNSIMREDESPTRSVVATNTVYAGPIEDGIGPNGPITQRSAVGGFHALALTVSSFDRLVDTAAKAAAGGSGVR
jgi:hypothetical protein